MPTVYWSKNAVASRGPNGETNYSNMRTAEESSANTNNTTSANIQVTKNQKFSGRGSPTFGLARAYFAFNMSGYTTGTITNLKFHFTPTASTSANLAHYIVKFSGFGENPASFNNWDATLWYSGLSITAAGTYTTQFTIVDGSTAASVSLNSTAVSDAQDDGYLQIGLLNSGDYNNLQPPSDVDVKTQFNIGSASTGNVFLQFDYAAPGFTASVNGTTVAYNTINLVPSSTIDEINDTDGG